VGFGQNGRFHGFSENREKRVFLGTREKVVNYTA
jgi:hypothetical protein